MAKIFLSFAKDDSELANDLSKHLSSLGNTVYVANGAIKPGQNFAQTVIDEFNKSEVIVQLITERSIKSQWSLTEFGMALGKRSDGTIIIPVVFDDVDLPLQLQQIQAIFASRHELIDVATQISFAISFHYKEKADSQKIQSEAQKRLTVNKYGLSLSVVLTIFGLFAIIIPDLLSKSGILDSRILIAIVASGIGMTLFPILYLKRTDIGTPAGTKGMSADSTFIKSTMQSIQHKSPDSSKNTEEFANQIYRKVLIQQKATIKRLEEELIRVIDRSTMSLIYGIVIGAAGLISLLVIIFATEWSESKTLLSFLQQVSPRFSLVILIEVLALFFLRLFKENLLSETELRNEITDIEFKYIAAKMAILGSANIDFSDLSRHFEISRSRTFYKDKADLNVSKSGFKFSFDNSADRKSNPPKTSSQRKSRAKKAQ